MKMKTILSVLGTVLLAGGMVLAQSSTGGTSKASTKHAQTSSSYNSGSAASDTSSPKAGNSGFDAGLPQSDASSSTSSSQSGTTPSSGSGAYSTQSSSMGSQSGSSEEISNGPVAETVSDSSAVIGWSTKEAASSTGIKYGTNRANLSQTAQATDGADGKNHHARLQSLSPSTRYYFQVTANGQPAGGVGTFRTTAAGDTPVQSKAVIPQK